MRNSQPLFRIPSIRRSVLLVCLLLSSLVTPNVGRATPTQHVKAVNCGGDVQGWYQADAFFSGGTVSAPSGSIDISKAYYPAPREVYRSLRYGNMTYTLTGLSANEKYRVRLHFAERTLGFDAVGVRVFDVAINGALVLDNYDVYADAGFQIAVVKEFNVTSTASGQISIQFSNVVQNAVINGIEVLPGWAYRISAGAVARAGQYQEDQYFSGGNMASTGAAVDTTLIQTPPPQAALQTQRTDGATFNYTIPGLVPGQRYNVRLYFAEFTKTAAGQRRFDVQLNGTRVLYQYDPFEAGGGPFKASERSFEAIANGSGQIVVTLVKGLDNPLINALDVAPQMTFKFDAGGFGAAPYDPDNSGYLVGSSDTLVTSNTIDLASVSNPAPEAVYRNARRTTSSMVYTLPGLLPGKLYHVRLHFAEIEAAKFSMDARKFDVRLNDILVLHNFDVFAAAGAGNKAVIKELTFFADPAGQLAIRFDNVTGGAIVSGIEVDREVPAAGYSVTQLGALGAPNTVLGRDGGMSALVGDKVLWFFGDTGLSSATDGTTTPPAVRWWMNTAGLSDKRTPWILTEALESGGRPRGQMVPFTTSQFDYNRAHFGSGWGCTTACDGTYFALWPGSIIREVDGNGLVFAGNGLIDLGAPEPGAPPSVGVVTFVQPAGVSPTNNSPVSTQNVLFPVSERQFGRAFVGNDGFVYSYQWEQGSIGELAVSLSAGVATGQLVLKKPLTTPLMAGQTVELSSGTSLQIVTVSATALPRATSVNVNSFVPNFSYPVDTGVLEPGCPIGVLSAPRNAGTSYTTVTVTSPLPAAVSTNQSIEIWSGNHVQTVTASATAPAGATSISVHSFTPSVTYSTGSQLNQSVSGPFTPPSFVARAPWAPVGSAAIRSNWTFWNQKLNGFAGGWDTNIANGTPLLYADGSRNWMVAPSVSWNAYLNKYLAIRGAVINDSVFLTTANGPQGPWAPELNVTKANSPIGTFGNYFMVQHPEMSLSSGQQIYVTYSHGGGKNYILQITLP